VGESARDTPVAGGVTPDTELVRRAAAGDTAAFEPLVRRYSDTIVRFARHMVGDFQAAEDIAQDTFLKAFSHIGRLEDAGKFTTWLYSIARHLCLDWIRARRPTVSMEALEADGVEVSGDPGDMPERSVETGEMHGHVLAELQRLRPDYREILLMKHVYELSYKEISEVAGLSVSAVGEKLSRVRELLRKRLRKAAGSQAGR
jgi:RNA polymerase sigma-70 factor (ECF subfamily)